MDSLCQRKFKILMEAIQKAHTRADFAGGMDGNRRSVVLRYTSWMRVLGIDCGGEYTGYGVVEMNGHEKLCCLACGAIKLSPRDPLPRRLSRIFGELGAIIAEHRPEQVAIEDVFYALNVKSALKLGQIRGVAMLAAAAAGLEVAEYSPLTIKSSVVGYGRAEKQQVQHMVSRLLRLAEPPEPMDVSDALAVAICHLHTAGTQQRQRGLAAGAARQSGALWGR
ncbi:MAG TPA: crossover junction endodeoxyribonuclease RuvC [Candidatus Aquilonibacter sp.]|nr:crossover junction endodeoxyribonuclease RuvC [Candidatus Aquilonibacter sp.]